MPLPSYPHESPRKVFYCLNEHDCAYNQKCPLQLESFIKIVFFRWTAIKENIKVT